MITTGVGAQSRNWDDFVQRTLFHIPVRPRQNLSARGREAVANFFRLGQPAADLMASRNLTCPAALTDPRQSLHVIPGPERSEGARNP